LQVVAVDAGKGPVTPSSAATENGQYHPLSRPLFIYVNSKSAQRSELKRFVEFYLAHARDLVPQVKYVPLPSEAYTVALGNFRNGKLGSAFQGVSLAGVRIEDLLRREARL
jgi:phosphate transport system substrate-binding protein